MNPYTVVIHVAYPGVYGCNAWTVYGCIIHEMYTVSLLHIDILYEFIVGDQDMPSYCDLLWKQINVVMRDVLESPVFCVAQECRNEIIKDGMRDVSIS